MEAKVYNQQGEEKGKIKLSPHIFGLPMNQDLLHQAVLVQLANSRKKVAHAKGRGEVRGGGRKPWPQKGTGRARHGSRRSPIWIGGGVTFGPTEERNYKKRMNKKMKKKALLLALSSKAKDDVLVVLDKLELKEGKTKKMAAILDNLSKKINKTVNKSVLIVLPDKDEPISRASKNIPKIEVVLGRNLNVLGVLKYKYLILTKEVIKQLESKFLKDKS